MMIQIKPEPDHKSNCCYCGALLEPSDILWQGIHICVLSKCPACQTDIIEDLKVGQAMFSPYQVDLKKGNLFGDQDLSKQWFGIPLIKSLQNPKEDDSIKLNIDKYASCEKVVFLNCIDFLYGHSLLKLLNAQAHIVKNKEVGLIVIVPEFLRWMVPQGAAEIWTVNISLSQGQNYYYKLNELIKKELERFKVIYVSKAYSHPKYFDITKFTGITKHSFNKEDFRITFIWREDRLWFNNELAFKIARKFGFVKLLLIWQKLKISKLFSLIHKYFPQATFTVAGLGKITNFPTWVDDCRVKSYTDNIERNMCKIYSESRMVIGVHGSNMLLPSAHAGFTLDLMPDDRWGNFAQDILYQEEDNRLCAYRYRYLPLTVTPKYLSMLAVQMINKWDYYVRQMIKDCPKG